MAEFYGHNARAICPDCNGTITTFEFRSHSEEFGYITVDKIHKYKGKDYFQLVYRLVRCAGCGRGGFYKAHVNGNDGEIEEFFPLGSNFAKLPKDTPPDIASEYRESEICASISAWRAATALLRSTLEKILKKNGYSKGDLKTKIDDAAKDGVITATKQKRAHEEIRSLGNDIMHDEWRIVTEDEFSIAHHYIQRIIEEFYDDRILIEKILREKQRI